VENMDQSVVLVYVMVLLHNEAWFSAHHPAYLAWVPSQKGPVVVCLQPHRKSVPSSSATMRRGFRPVPLCAPSQSGCSTKQHLVSTPKHKSSNNRGKGHGPALRFARTCTRSSAGP
jgi:hypothetical protein